MIPCHYRIYGIFAWLGLSTISLIPLKSDMYACARRARIITSSLRARPLHRTTYVEIPYESSEDLLVLLVAVVGLNV